MKIRTQLQAGGGGVDGQHNESLRRDADRKDISMRRRPQITVRKGDRLELLVIRAGRRAGAAGRNRFHRGA